MNPSRSSLGVLWLAVAVTAACRGANRPAADTARTAAASASAAGSAASAASGREADSAVVAAMRRVYDGIVRRDSTAAGSALPDSGMLFVAAEGIFRTRRDAIAGLLKECVDRSFAMDSVQTEAPSPDIVLLTFRLTVDETCGKKRSPATQYVLSAWQRQASGWKTLALAVAARPGGR